MATKKDITRESLFTSAHHDYRKGLNSHAFFRVQSRETGEDLVQETFMKTWSYLVRGGKIDLMKAFLYHVLNDLIVDEYRKRKTLSLDVLIEKGFEPRDKSTNSFLNILDGQSALLLIQRLPLKYQKIMRMKYVNELSLAEMSLVTGQSKTTLAVQAHRGMEKLKILYKENRN